MKCSSVKFFFILLLSLVIYYKPTFVTADIDLKEEVRSLKNAVDTLISKQEKLISKQEKQEAQQNEINTQLTNLYHHIVNANDDILKADKEVMAELLKRRDKLTREEFAKLAPVVIPTPSIYYAHYPYDWRRGFVFQGNHPTLFLKYRTKSSRYLSIPISHNSNYSDSYIPIKLPNDKQKYSYILISQLGEIDSRNVLYPVTGGINALRNKWKKIYIAIKQEFSGEKEIV